MAAFIVFGLLALRSKSFMITYYTTNYYIQWLLLLFLVIFSASLSERDDFDSGDGKRCSIHKYLMQYSNFALKLNSQLWMET